MTKTIHIRNSITLLTGLMLCIALLLPVMVGAQEEDRERGRKTDVAERVEERKETAKEKVDEKRETREVKSAEKRTQSCEKRQDKVVNAMSRINTKANRYIGVVDSFYVKVQGFYDKGQLTVSNYDELTAAVDVAQLAAQNEIAALAELNVEIDCEDPDTALLAVGAYRDSASVVKTALKEYRRSLVDLISAMKSAADSDNTDDSDEVDTTDKSDESEESEETKPENSETPETETSEEEN